MKKQKDMAKEYCEICKDYHEFIFPDDLFEALENHQLVIFAGAGISTEKKNLYPSSLYEEICKELGYSHANGLSFSKVMSDYCKKTGDRRGLIERIIKRIEYIRSFPELYNNAIRFHNHLARIPCIHEIVTTNWDDFFEVECHATPFVYEQDLAFWERPERRVLKLHGSINNLGSIVATTGDYKKRYQSLNTGLVGSQLKLLIANRKLVFVGYSFRDEDFSRIYSFVRAQLSDFLKKSYVVTLDETNDLKWRELGLEPIHTSGEYFLQVLAHKLEIKGCLIPSKTIRLVEEELALMWKEHSRLTKRINLVRQPEGIFCFSYQDGVIHAFEHFLHHVNYGESLCKPRLTRVLDSYKKTIKKKKTQRRWFDVAYLQGYMNGHFFVLADEETNLNFPRYYDLGSGTESQTLGEYLNSLNKTEGRKKSITAYAMNSKMRIPDKSIVAHHPAFL